MTDTNSKTSLDVGSDIIREYVKDLTVKPGVYRMMNEAGEVLYVGKAKALKKRVTSYTQVNRLPYRLQKMVAQTRKMEFVLTNSEAEALLLEANLIKQLKPKYNILLRDDKSFPYILLRQDHDYPMVVKYRGKKKGDGQYFGPFASARDVMRTLKSIQRVFLIRNCTDSNFSNRSRPCLQYHIKRCTAPCVGYVSKDEYAQQVDEARAFLEGKNEDLLDKFRSRMEEASEKQDYELAALYRDRFKALLAITSKQDVNVASLGDVDVIGLYMKGGQSCVQVFFYRGGQNHGNYAYFPRHADDVSESDILSTFLAQFYLGKPLPKTILVSHAVQQKAALEEAFTSIVERKVTIVRPQRGDKKTAIDFAVMNAEQALSRRALERQSELKYLKDVSELFDMDDIPKRIEIYDNSHISGTNMVGAMVVAGLEGFNKNAYRKFNIKEALASDDYGMMREVMQRRFRKVKEGELSPGDAEWPDLLLIDGGKGQLSTVKEVLEEYGILDDVTLVAIAKGEDRNAGREQFFMDGKPSFDLPHNSATLHYLQRLRDEAHRFAVHFHQVRRKKSILNNSLDAIDGIGAKKKAALMRYFGSAKSVAGASVYDLQKVDGISEKLAQQIYDHFH